ncbi:MAG TPA: metalloregulator ArsR/SmtB family transcription factor [Candidatus Lokiarchaeia archaeon]|nr:metalloregulator ArsR/SmtB family transcription factor [Candidatus Lokiarchaeia archaeon]
MANHNIEPCCPTDPQQRAAWEEKMQGEKDKMIMEVGSALAERESILKTLGHTVRLAILHELGNRSNCVCELVTKLEVANSAISYHLSFLAKYAMIQAENRAGRMYYHLTDYGKQILEWLDGMPLREENPDST